MRISLVLLISIFFFPLVFATSDPYIDGWWEYPLTSGDLPPPLSNHTMVSIPGEKKILLFGGFQYDGDYRYYNDVYELNLENFIWKRLATSLLKPSARLGHSAFFSPYTWKMYIFGGYWPPTNFGNDVWEFNPTNNKWTRLTTGSNPPQGRQNATIIFDPRSRGAILFGGRYIGLVWFSFQDTFLMQLDPLNWIELQPSGKIPSARSSAAGIYDPDIERILIWGGYLLTIDTRRCYQDLWSYNTLENRWEEEETTGEIPEKRGDHTAVYDPFRKRMVIFGGQGEEDDLQFNDVHALSLESMEWEKLHPNGEAPRERSAHSSVFAPEIGGMVIYGGQRGSQDSIEYLDDLIILRWLTPTPTFTPTLTPSPSPLPSDTSTATPTSTPTAIPSPPKILVCGYMNSDLNSSQAGFLHIFVLTSSDNSDPIEKVELYYQGEPTGMLIQPDEFYKDVYQLFLNEVPPVGFSGKIQLEIMATTINGFISDLWPYIFSDD